MKTGTETKRLFDRAEGDGPAEKDLERNLSSIRFEVPQAMGKDSFSVTTKVPLTVQRTAILKLSKPGLSASARLALPSQNWRYFFQSPSFPETSRPLINPIQRAAIKAAEAPRPKDHRNVPVISAKWPVNTGLIIAPTP
jgi:hypothetical protein